MSLIKKKKIYYFYLIRLIWLQNIFKNRIVKKFAGLHGVNSRS